MSQQPHSGPHQREDPPSPGSTRVMTRMRELSREILEPHSGWGRSGRAVSRRRIEAREADRGTGVSPRRPRAGTMSTAASAGEHLARRPAHREEHVPPSSRGATPVVSPGVDRAGVGREMKFRVAREVLADGVAWTARSLPPRPSVPVLAGILLEVDGNQLSVSGFDYEVSARAEVDVHATEGGRVLVPGRLLAEI